MATAALAERVQPQAASRKGPRMEYERGQCPSCKQPMLVKTSMPNAPCVDCYVKPK